MHKVEIHLTILARIGDGSSGSFQASGLIHLAGVPRAGESILIWNEMIKVGHPLWFTSGKIKLAGLARFEDGNPLSIARMEQLKLELVERHGFHVEIDRPGSNQGV